MGECERNSGLCDCREGFGGKACEKLLCPVDGDAQYCSGHGLCLPMWRAAEGNDFVWRAAGLDLRCGNPTIAGDLGLGEDLHLPLRLAGRLPAGRRARGLGSRGSTRRTTTSSAAGRATTVV